ncbi:histidine kinase CKI1-like [Punica granatum]|uniref:histidine kinase n=1 Tax=Punica granatum TaxID=22663 RepID=A0A6P8E5A5_PUNGR|nr:histidine kinase CKI1-like [Punica granatum]
MKLSSCVASRPLCFFTFLAFVVLVIPVGLVPFWRGIMSRIEREVDSDSARLKSLLISEIEQTAKLMIPLNFTATNLARVCNSSLNGPEVSFADIESKVAPLMFQTLSVVPFVSEISYIGLGGLFFSYYLDGNRVVSLYANSSSPSNSSSYNWYKQLVDPDTGNLYGIAFPYHPLVHTDNSGWFRKAVNSSSGYFASLEAGWNSDQDLVLTNTARLGIGGIISVGVPVNSLKGMFLSMNLEGASLYLISQDGRLLLQGLPNTQPSLVGDGSVSFEVKSGQGEMVQLVNLTCDYSSGGDDKLRDARITYLSTTYVLYCSHIKILGIESVYILAVPDDSLTSTIRGKSKLVLILFVTLIVALLVAVLSFVCIIAGSTRREMHLCARLIEHMEATQQAERKSMRKSKAFVEASHNIRTSLACITTLIENSYHEAATMPELVMNLQQMDKCANELLGILNSILDTSKIEAGEMQLEEEDFNLAQLLEDSVDMFHPFAMNKDVDLVLDFFDGSVLEHSFVRGDKRKLKQILSNLLHNAVKFTPKGHITVRVWAQKMSLENVIIADNQKGWRKNLSGLFFGKDVANQDVQEVVAFQRNPNSMEFVFEVNDTGKGIPKEKRKSVFEDYNQIKDASEGQGGTGLGLGSVQSFVRLMGGDIKIVDKDIGEKGTCFRFNVVLTVLGNISASPDKSMKGEDIELGPQREINPWPCLTIRTPSPSRSLSMRGSPKQNSSPRPVGSSGVVLLMGDEERRRVCRSFFERFGIRVWEAREWTDLPFLLRTAQQKLNLSHHSSSGRSDVSHQKSESLSRSASKNSSKGSSPSLPVHSRSGFLLLVIDMSFGPIQELIRFVRAFRKGIHSSATSCKVVWLDKPRANYRIVLEKEGKLDRWDNIIVSRPFHGSRLIEAIRLLPEFGGSSVVRNQSLKMKSRKLGLTVGEVDYSTSSIREVRGAAPGASKPLSGKRALVVEDQLVLQKAAKALVMNLGASVEVCGNGEEAVLIVSGRLGEQKGLGDGASSSAVLTYDFILMDCQLPRINGYEATRRIREEEKRYNVRIPIIALTAHSGGPEVKMTSDAGMDSYLQKPLTRDSLMEILCKLNIA